MSILVTLADLCYRLLWSFDETKVIVGRENADSRNFLK